jgi:uncharacterized cupin superfamily protein
MCPGSTLPWPGVDPGSGNQGRGAARYISTMKKIDIERAPRRTGTTYPPPYDLQCRNRVRVQLGKAAGLAKFGVNRLRLPSGQWSSQRHWHHAEDEFVLVLEGEVVLVTDGGEEVLRAGDCAGFRAGDPDGHHLQNRSSTDAVVLEVGSSAPDDVCEYPDIDMRGEPAGYVHRDGAPYGTPPRR